MPIVIDPKLDARIRECAEAEGFVRRGVRRAPRDADQSAIDELESLALEGLNSGDPITPGPGFWEEMHRRLDERLKNASV